MRAFLLDLLKFLAFALVMYPIAIVFAGKFIPYQLHPNLPYLNMSHGHSSTRLAEVKTVEPGVDVLFLGSSHAYRGFDPRNFPGLRCFNLGSVSQTPVQTNMLLDRYLDQLHPRFVVYAGNPLTVSMDGVESALNLIPSDRVDRHSWAMALQVNHIKVYNTLIYTGCIQALSKAASPSGISTEVQSDSYVPGGYVEREITTFRHMVHEPKTTRPYPDQVQAFRAMVQRLDARGIPLLLVKAPVTATFDRCFVHDAEFDSLFRSTGHPYLDFQDMVALDDSLHFYDAHHMNQHGVDLFNAALLEYLPGGAHHDRVFPPRP